MDNSAAATESPSETPGDSLASSSPHTPWRLPAVLQVLLIVLLLGSAVASGKQLTWYWSHGARYSDLKIFVTGIEMMKTGQRHQLYHFDAQQQVQERLYPEMRGLGLLPFNHLAYELLFYWPVSQFSYGTAQRLWGVFNAGLVLLIAWLMKPFTKGIQESLGIPLILWILGFYPVLVALGEGQDSVVFLLLVVISARLATSRQESLAGFVLGLALFKVHLTLGIAFFVFFLPRKWRGLAGFAAGAAFVTGISWLMVGPSFATDYLYMLRHEEALIPWDFNPWFMPNLRALLECGLERWMGIGSIRPIILVASLLVVGATWVALRMREVASAPALYSAAIPAVALVSYHMFAHDLTMALVSMLILLDACVRGKFSWKWTVLLALSVAVFYVYGAAVLLFRILAIRGFLLVIPTILLWIVAIGIPNAVSAGQKSALSE